MPYPHDTDLDPNNPVDMSQEAVESFYERVDDFEDFLDHDHSMDF